MRWRYLMDKLLLEKLKTLTILYAEDEEGIRKNVTKTLQYYLKRVVEASCGDEALRLYHSEKPDIVFTDIMMPVMDGIEATKVIREIEKRENKYTPIIAFTANTLNNDYHTCKSNGMDHLLEKPFSVSKFTQILEELDN